MHKSPSTHKLFLHYIDTDDGDSKKSSRRFVGGVQDSVPWPQEPEKEKAPTLKFS